MPINKWKLKKINIKQFLKEDIDIMGTKWYCLDW